MKLIDKYLNRITTYRLVLYFLICLVAVSSFLGFLSTLPYSGTDVIFSSIIAVIVCYIANFVVAKILHATTNIESVFITALIITLIFPITFPLNFVPLVSVCIVAMISKYLLTIQKIHVFNPAAVAVFLVSYLFTDYSAIWWVGTSALFFPVLIGGYLVVRKIRKEAMVFCFLLTFVIISGTLGFAHGGSLSSIVTTWKQSFSSSAVLFFAFIMFTEPLTAPSSKKLQKVFGVLVGVLYSTPLMRLSIVLTPEMALLAGNLFSYFSSPKYRLTLSLMKKIKLSSDTYLFEFEKPKNFIYIPGQYLEWTLPHAHVDSRGNRRYFSIASAPFEHLMLHVKFNIPPSSYKKALQNLEPGDEIIATSLSGDFIMPRNVSKPLAFIAGGVGIAPFRSMIGDIIEKKKMVNIVLVFANKRKEDIIFQDVLQQATQFGVKPVYILTDREKIEPTWKGHVGHVDDKMLQMEIPDYKNRIFYVSGPQLMVQNLEELLLRMGVKRKNLKSDFFPGYSETTT